MNVHCTCIVRYGVTIANQSSIQFNNYYIFAGRKCRFISFGVFFFVVIRISFRQSVSQFCFDERLRALFLFPFHYCPYMPVHPQWILFHRSLK